MTTRHASPQGRAAQRGAALLTAMVIVTLIATLAASMVWQQWRAIQVEAAERSQTQAQWILNGALDWALLILREDGRTSADSDHLGEPWAVPLAEARLSTFLAADRNQTDDAPDAFLSGAIRDAQSRYNLRNLVSAQGPARAVEIKTLENLCEMVGVSRSVGSSLAAQLLLTQPVAPGGTAAAPGTPGTPAPTAAPATTSQDNLPLLPPGVEQLGWLGIDAASLAKLLPHLILLPRVTPINLNTASKEVIAAVLDITLADADRLVQLRLRTPLKTMNDAAAALPAQALTARSKAVGVASGYFEVTGVLRLDPLVVAQRSLVERDRQNRSVRVLSTERIRRPDDIATSLQQ
ncbi:MAG: type II secretion system minor pseudopilin GspK [Burkholderiales bacterium]